MSDLKLYQKSYDLLVWIFNKTDGFPKSKRFSVGQRLENLLLDFISLLNKYQYSKKQEKSLIVISQKFDEIKLLLKICHDTKLLSHGSFAYTIDICGEIGAMIGGLVKASEKNI